ncbi:GGDEF domain-containing protein [uncultured Sphingomonas sp.]|uniref:GGDEF domain-containing protein n=1 Tax=uncultured Sphingomonas sp. TaxID=158754 RepID=UPI0025D6D50C|nr:GGDEF domain-containing protein [uncultured Sphingomonas sp.]
MLLDISTLYVMVALCSVVAGIVHLTAAAGGRFDSWANWWGCGHLLLGVSAVAPLLRWLHIPGLLPIGNAIAAASYGVIYIGMRRFADPAAPVRPWIVLAWIVALPLLFWSDPAGMGQRIAYLNVIRSLFDVATVVLAMRIARQDALRTGWIVAVMFAMTVPMFLGRAWLAVTGQLGSEPTGMHGGPAAWMAAAAIAFIMFRGFSLLTMDAERCEQRLAMLAERDGLTGASNRTAFDRARPTWRGDCAVLMIDLNRFKALNDRHGHAAGDAALKVATRAAVVSIPMNGRVFRWGGDEFVCVLPGMDAPAAAALAQAIADRFTLETAALFGADDGADLSVGWATGPCAMIDRLIEQADERMYAQKHRNRQPTPIPQRSVAECAPSAPLISQSQHG